MKRAPQVTSRIMASVHSKNTGPEKKLRKALRALGRRYRLNAPNIPGRPDFAFLREKVAVFVDGDFWHGNSWRLRGFRSLDDQFKKWRNTEFWIKKVRQNIARDGKVEDQLRLKEWRSLRLWESEINENMPRCVKRVMAALSHAGEPRERFTSLELFTGAGGLALGLAHAGFDHLAIVEWDRNACSTIRLNQEHLPIVSFWPVFETDVRKFDFSPYSDRATLLAAGVPCQPFSLGGKHEGDRDSRNMFPDVIRAIQQLRPKVVIIENVKGLLRTVFKEYFDYLLLQIQMPEILPKPHETWRAHKTRLLWEQRTGRLHSLRYKASYQLINCADYGVPQFRERVFIVATRADLNATWAPLRPTHSEEALLYAQWVDHTYWIEHDVKVPTVPSQLRNRVRAIKAKGLPPTEQRWRTVRDALRGLPAPTLQGNLFFFNHIGNPGARSYPGHTGSPYDWPAKTLKAGVHGVPGGENTLRYPNGRVRYFTAREAARIQTFPDEFRFSGAWTECLRQIGNAVPSRIAQFIGVRIREMLSQGSATGDSEVILERNDSPMRK